MSANRCDNGVSERMIQCKAQNNTQPWELPAVGEYQKITFEKCDTTGAKAKLLLKPPHQGIAGNSLWLTSANGYDLLGFRTHQGEGPREGQINLEDPKNFPNPSQKILSLRPDAALQTFCVTTFEDSDLPQPAQHGFYEMSYVERLRGTNIAEHSQSYEIELGKPGKEVKLAIKNARGQRVIIRLKQSDQEASGPILLIMSIEPYAAGKYFVADPEMKTLSFRHGRVYSAALDLRDKNDFDFDHPVIGIVPNTNDQTFIITTVRAAGW